MSLDLSVIITTYNSADHIERVLDSLRALPPGEQPAEIIVVDNASSDSSADLALARGARVIRSRINTGLARGNNTGAREASGSHLLFLNPDTLVHRGSLETLHRFAEGHPRASILGPAMVDMTDEIQSTARTYPGLVDIALRRTFLGRLPGAEARLARHMFPYPLDRPARVDWLLGAALWLTPSGRESIGLMPENYFLYFEDVEWCWMANHSGGEVWYVPDAVIAHEFSRDSAGRSVKALWHHLVSMFRFFIRHPSALSGSIRKAERS